ncbi:MAG: putative aliphatic sulfonates transport permease protein SsuC [Paracidovorax wautersii]|uniref:Putative aliphatic sulfonates transport permease protein SsuC n=1 Tax=Paracidovorax wautersii TaxID=1177982 RepID=A0A7V8FRV6_9BURK|nr:MAG: putative aliphatic sulfonates transport permease protein SsuC [Paracidovorax wautersii]
MTPSTTTPEALGARGQLATGVSASASASARPRVPAWLPRAVDAALPWLLPLALLVLWQLGADQGWISPQVLPPPAFVVDTLRDLAASGDLWLHVQASLQRVVVGFAVGSLLGLALGVAMGLIRSLEAYLLPTFNALVQIPVLAWLPFVLLLVGIGEPLKYILIAKAALVPVTLNTLQGFRQAPTALLEVARVYGYTRRQQVLEVVLPQAVPALFTGLRLGFTKAWLSLVVVELVASSEGLGYLIVYGRQLFQLDLVMAAVLIVGAIGYLIDRLLDAAERRVARRAAAGGLR